MNTAKSDDGIVTRLRTRRTHKKILTNEQRRDQQFLKKKWDEESKKRTLSFAEIATRWGVHSTAPGKFVGGSDPIPDVWYLRFAMYLDCRPQDIWPHWEYSALTGGDIPPSLHTLAALWKLLTRAMRADVIAYIQKTYGKLLPKTLDLFSVRK
jgi:hypothetical protein